MRDSPVYNFSRDNSRQKIHNYNPKLSQIYVHIYIYSVNICFYRHEYLFNRQHTVNDSFCNNTVSNHSKRILNKYEKTFFKIPVKKLRMYVTSCKCK